VVKELANLESLHGITIGEDLFHIVCKTMKEHELPWTKLKSITTNGTQSVTGKKTDFEG
jgi:hypothetical protein